VFTTIFLFVVMLLGYGGIVYGGTSQAFLFLGETRGYSAGFIFALTAWAGVAGTGVYVLNAFFGERLEGKYTQFIGALLYIGGWWGLYEVHNTAGIYILYCMQQVGLVVWLWSMYVYIPGNYPTRIRSLGTGWTDGIGHLGPGAGC
jgi:hypothetical protein